MKNPIIWGYLSCLVLAGCTDAIQELSGTEEEATVIRLDVYKRQAMERTVVQSTISEDILSP